MKFNISITIGTDSSNLIIYAESLEDATIKLTNIIRQIGLTAENMIVNISNWHTIESKKKEEY